jgi:IS30 family transposase
MAEGPLSQRREHACVPRNHLPQLIHPGPWSAEKGADSAPAVQEVYPSLTALRAGGKSHGQIVDAISIRERPAEVEDRAVPGHWEGDLLAGSKNTHIATLVERHSRFVMLIKVPSKDTTTVVAALSKHVLKLPATLRRSLTWDRGHEMAKHKSFTVDTNVKVYFCDPQSPWQRGSNENTNGLLRQYFPKKTDLSVYSQAHLNKIALRLNQRPRETLGFQTPADKLQASVASTG